MGILVFTTHRQPWDTNTPLSNQGIRMKTEVQHLLPQGQGVSKSIQTLEATILDPGTFEWCLVLLQFVLARQPESIAWNEQRAPCTYDIPPFDRQLLGNKRRRTNALPRNLSGKQSNPAFSKSKRRFFIENGQSCQTVAQWVFQEAGGGFKKWLGLQARVGRNIVQLWCTVLVKRNEHEHNKNMKF